jgi:hypothetical protein
MSHVMRHGRCIETVRIDDPAVAQVSRTVRQKHFIRLPLAWADRLDAARSTATFKVAHRILRLHFLGRGRPVQLGSSMLMQNGISRAQKQRALLELEQLGLVQVRRRLRKSPIVTVLLNEK